MNYQTRDMGSTRLKARLGERLLSTLRGKARERAERAFREIEQHIKPTARKATVSKPTPRRAGAVYYLNP